MNKQVESLEKWAAKCGLETKDRRAQTSTHYLSVETPKGTAKIRIADHADAYATADYSIDPAEGTLAGAKAFLEDVIAGRVSLAKLGRAVKRMESERHKRYTEYQEKIHGEPAMRCAAKLSVDAAAKARAILNSRPSRRNNGQGNQNWRGELAELTGGHRNSFRNPEFVRRLHRAVAKRAAE